MQALFHIVSYYFFLAAFFFFTAGDTAGRLFPNEPLNLFPLAVFLSPLPIYVVFKMNDTAKIVVQILKKPLR